MNYSYVLGLHVMKSCGVEIVGYSHEYGYDCITEIVMWKDVRLLLPLVIALVILGLLFNGMVMSKKKQQQHYFTNKQNNIMSRSNEIQEERIQYFLHVIVFLSWMATLFPIAGILKVGTFVADRIAVASSFGTCIYGGRLLALWIASSGDDDEGEKKKKSDGNDATTSSGSKRRQNINITKTILKVLLLCYLCTFQLAKRTHNRTAQWIDSVPLLESSLVACPRSIKSNLEMSKIYSGLVPHMIDFEKSL